MYPVNVLPLVQSQSQRFSALERCQPNRVLQQACVINGVDEDALRQEINRTRDTNAVLVVLVLINEDVLMMDWRSRLNRQRRDKYQTLQTIDVKQSPWLKRFARELGKVSEDVSLVIVNPYAASDPLDWNQNESDTWVRDALGICSLKFYPQFLADTSIFKKGRRVATMVGVRNTSPPAMGPVLESVAEITGLV